MMKNKQSQVIERIMFKAFGEDGRYFTTGYPDTFGTKGFVECKAWPDNLRPNQIEFYNYLKNNNLEHLWWVATEDQQKNVHVFKTPDEYQKFKEKTKRKNICWERLYPDTIIKTGARTSDGCAVYEVKCPDPFQNPRCKGIRTMTRKAVADSAKVLLGLCQSCASLKKNGYGERLNMIREQASKGTLRQSEFAKTIGMDQGSLSNVVKSFGIEWKRIDGRASNKRY